MRGLRLLLSWLLAGVSCSQPSIIAPDLGGDVDLVGLIVERGDAVASTTGLLPFSGKVVSSLDLEDGDIIHVLGFSRPSLAEEVDLVSDERLTRESLAWAGEHSPRLPPAVFYGTTRYPNGTVETSPEVPDVTAGWLAPCPKLFRETGDPILARCEAVCGGRVSQSGCGLDFSGVCLPDLEDAFVNGLDRIVPGDPSGLDACARTEIRSFETDAYVCSGVLSECRISRPNLELAEAFDVRETYVYEGSVSEADLSAPVAVANEVALLRYPGGRADPTDPRVVSQPPTGCDLTELVFFDRDSLSLSRVVEVPPCLYRFRVDPAGTGFLALSNAESALEDRIYRLSAAGTATSALLPSFEDAVPMRLAASERDLLVLYNQGGVAANPGSPLVLLDAQSFEVKDSLSFNGVDSVRREITALVNTDLHSFAFLDKETDGVVFLDTSGGILDERRVVPITTSEAPGCPTSNIKLRAAYYDKTSGAVLAGNGGNSPSIIALLEQTPARCAEGTSYEPPSATPLSFTSWPHDEAHPTVVATFFTLESRTTLALFDLEEGFVRPGAIDLGEGLAKPPFTDDDGTVWVTLGGPGKLLRIRPQ